ncbi:MAG: thermonuclease family protein [Thermoleophilia bacterium]|nr:thermonuclease family protein [Thermoleophilia bacterium]
MRSLAAALCALALAACSSGGSGGEAAGPDTGADAGPEPATTAATAEPPVAVARVADGDTLELGDGRRVRLVQIDAPEHADECYGREATSALRELLAPGDAVTLERDPRLDDVDEHGRLLRYVRTGSRNLNLLLVRRGAATPYFYRGERGAYAERLLRAARQARAAKRGLWGACPGTPLEPGRAADTGPVVEAEPLAAGCPGAIPWTEARAHIGERAIVRGPVAGTRYAADADGQPTFLNLGRDHPDPERVTVLIWGDDRGRFPEPPEDAYAGRTICASGELELYEGVPELELSTPAQIAVVG